VGKVRYIVLDTRTYRTNSIHSSKEKKDHTVDNGQILGEKQLRWFIKEIDRANEDPKVEGIIVFCNIPWMLTSKLLII
jgi:phosphodiesterase/alkaline phosphatase D-like protein